MSNSKTQPREVDVVIETRDVAARFECPHCSCEHRVDMCEFDERGLWYGEECYVCDECGGQFDLNGSVERDV